MIKVAVFGAKGRMGTAVCQAVEEAEDTELVAAVDSGGDRSDASGADVIVDFTTPDAVMDNLSWAISHDINTVVGTTGFDDERYQVLRDQLAERGVGGVDRGGHEARVVGVVADLVDGEPGRGVRVITLAPRL